MKKDMCILSGRFKLLHQGHCGGSGYTTPNTDKPTIDDCRIECASRDGVKYFAYKSKSTCACYKTECYYDGQYMDHIAYEIIESGSKISIEILIILYSMPSFKNSDIILSCFYSIRM